MFVLRRALPLLMLTLLAACASPVHTPALALDDFQALQWRGLVDERLRGQVELGEVQGADRAAEGSGTSEQTLLHALEDQLRALRLMAGAPQSARYRLDVQLLRLDLGGHVMSAKVEAELRYQLRERGEGGRVLYERKVRSAGSANWLDHGAASGRKRLATEAALRSNLGMLARDLISIRV